MDWVALDGATRWKVQQVEVLLMGMYLSRLLVDEDANGLRRGAATGDATME